jgi:hypothetical protein
MRHSAVSRYHWFSGRMSAEFNVGTQLVPLAKTSLLSELIAGRAVEYSRRFGGAAAQKFLCVRNWKHGALRGTLATQLSKWSR